MKTFKTFLSELYYLQPSGYWVNNADGRSKGRTKKELLDYGISKSKIKENQK